MKNPSLLVVIGCCWILGACGEMSDADSPGDISVNSAVQTLGDGSEGELLTVADQHYLRVLAASYSYQGQMSNLVVTHTHSPDCRDFGRFVMERRDEVDAGMDALARRYQVGLAGVLSTKQSYRLHKLECCVWFFEKSYFKYLYKELRDLKSRSQYALHHSRNSEVVAWARYALDTIDLTLRLSAAGNTPDL